MNMFQQHIKKEQEKVNAPSFKKKQEPIRRFTEEERVFYWEQIKSKSSYINLRKDIDNS